MRNWRATLEWYRTHQTTRQIGFDPDGMCLKLCRTARGIGPMFLTAKQAQDATPKEHRITSVRNLRRGMVLYFDEAGDSNTSGHIVTMIGRVKNPDLDSLNDILVETNSVKSGESVVVRASYFPTHWNDKFKFGAVWLNGEELDIPAKRREPELGDAREENFRDTAPNWDIKILDRAIENGNSSLKPAVKGIEMAVSDLPKDEGDTRVREFKKAFNENRVLKMPLLNKAVEEGRTGSVKLRRDRIQAIIKKILF